MDSPLYRAEGDAVFKRPVKNPDGITMGFIVCVAADGVNADDIAALLNIAAEQDDE